MTNLPKTAQSLLAKLVLSSLVLVLAVVQPMGMVLAADEVTSSATTTGTTEAATPPATPTPAVEPPAPVAPTAPAPAAPVTGPSQPTGADSATYVQNPTTGAWENDHYIWDPVSHQTRPKQLPDYYYDPATGTWSTNDWVFDAASGRYIAAPQPVPAALLAALGLLPNGDRARISNTGPNSNNQINAHDLSNGAFNLFTKAEINNYFNLYSLSGNASVNGNTEGGGATTGDASAMANILNLLSSAWNVSGGKMVTFMQSLFGDVNGDIVLDTGTAGDSGTGGSGSGAVSSIHGTGPGSNNTIDDTQDGTLTINESRENDINNNIVLAAKSGDAGVSGNTKAGDAKSGDAKVLLNLINIINSSIHSGKSFFGVLNIFGNFNGDVLFSKDFLQQALASSNGSSGNTSSIDTTGPNSNNTIDSSRSGNMVANTTDLNTINNNVVSNAKSGNADVGGNTSAGDASTGSAQTKLNILNLTGHNVIAKNAVLVFVNVFGHWVGLIMDAPQGSKSALVGGGVSQNSVTPVGNITSNTTSDNTINNNLDLSAESGNASVNGNTEAGDATSGDADIAANVGNIIGSNLDISGWFGVLFINVFGNWFGSFGVDTAAGNTPAPSSTDANAASTQSTSREMTAGVPTYSATAGGIMNSVANVEDTLSNIHSQLPQNASTVDYKKPVGHPFSDYAFPLFALIAVSIGGMLYQRSRKYSK